ncbi:NAD(P)/FAD-dependent oxidoreductase [Actinospica durhamensis]|uniref:NAD(P)/FAD-dependent oxidoreductase n=1 Tax=Actinospica durhamensis TaxID=1508375 RepID=A0A941EJ75_9ACTN|nr:NAD(P)/FAD-dependent oxidoreductase [Actinospica durhamensis]MBR7832532.1 NAD(P)/FAD-dependent oxidoreductase [Actinospica durhamensis]
MIDVLVVGGGPAGLATAILADRAGLSTAVAEPRTSPVDKACGEGLMPAAVARLAALGVDPPGQALRGIRYLQAERGAEALFSGPPGRGVRRTALHEALIARVAEARIPLLPVRVEGFTRGPGYLEAAGIRARHLVAADGLHSPIRRACGLNQARPAGSRNALPRYGLRRHYRTAPWTDLIEVHWARDSEAYVTPVAPDLVGVAILGPGRGGFEDRLAAFPDLRARLAAARVAGPDRGAGPLRQDVRRRTAADGVLLVGDASGYLDALTGEGISVALAQAEALAHCLARGCPEEYERRWHEVSRTSRRLTAGLLWARHNPLLRHGIVSAAGRLPLLFTALVNRVAEG